MILLIILLSIILIPVIFLIILPIRIEANSIKGYFQIYMPVFFKAGIFGLTHSPEIGIRIFFTRVSLSSILRKYGDKDKNDKQVKEKKEKKGKNGNKIKNPVRFFKYIMKGIRIKKLRWDIDTGDFPLNARLIPLASALNNQAKTITINFENRNVLLFLAETRIINIIIQLIKYKLSN